jgi:hypothetical protein
MHPAGYWEEEGPGYRPKYRSTVWSLILLAQLGASAKDDDRISKACSYYLDQALTAAGQFTIQGTPSTNIDCLQGNMLTALLDLGYEDPRIETAFDWLARSITGDGVAPMSSTESSLRYYSGNIGPGFRCGANQKEPCAWGGSKAMLAFGKLPSSNRSPLINQAIQQGLEFLLSCEPSTADYPHGENPKPSGNWWKFGFPVFYVTDLLQIFEALSLLGYGDDPRLAKTEELIHSKMTPSGKWLLEYAYTGKTWVDFGQKNEPNKWVTIRAIRALAAAQGE